MKTKSIMAVNLSIKRKSVERKDLKVDYAIELYNNKDYSVSKIEELTGVLRSTLYRRLREKQTA